MEIESWLVSDAQCLQCGHKWVAVHPIACDDFECPECGSRDTVREENHVS